MIKTGCILQAHHKLPVRSLDNEPLSSAPGREKSHEDYKTLITTINISEAHALTMVHRLWPGEALLGATCGRGFEIESEEQAAVVNEILAPDICINFNFEKHQWTLQTWPEEFE